MVDLGLPDGLPKEHISRDGLRVLWEEGWVDRLFSHLLLWLLGLHLRLFVVDLFSLVALGQSVKVLSIDGQSSHNLVMNHLWILADSKLC